MIKKEQIFPLLLILLDVCAAVVYAGKGDVRKTIYWLAAAVLSAAVTF
jgi:Cdc6-like AAA superfamily ATPase